MHLYITALMAAALALLLVVLATITIALRMRHRAPFGDGGQQPLTAAIRAHGNLAEYMPIGITLTGLLEASGVDTTILGSLAAGFVASRCLNAIGLFFPPGPPPPWPRAIGIVATLLILATMAIWLLVSVLGAMMG